MNTKMIAGGALTGLVMATGIAGMVSAQSAADATGLTEDQIIAIALTEVPGEVIEVEREREDGQQVFEVEILGADGVEMEITLAADTGDILEVAADDDDEDDHDDKDCDEDDEA